MAVMVLMIMVAVVVVVLVMEGKVKSDVCRAALNGNGN